MKTKLLGVLTAFALFGAVPQASADILQVNLSGTYAGTLGDCVPCGFVPYSSFIGNPFTGQFVFDSSTGTLSSPSPGVNKLVGANAISADLIVTGGLGGTHIFNGVVASYLEWQTDSLGNLIPLGAGVVSNGGSNRLFLAPREVIFS